MPSSESQLATFFVPGVPFIHIDGLPVPSWANALPVSGVAGSTFISRLIHAANQK